MALVNTTTLAVGQWGSGAVGQWGGVAVQDSAPTAAPEYHILTRTGRPMPRDWLLLDKYDLYYHRIGNLIWAVGSLIGICLTNEYQPRVIAEGLLPLQAVFPGLDVKLMDSKIKVEPMVHEIRGLRYEPHMVNVTPNSAISGYLQSYKCVHSCGRGPLFGWERVGAVV